MSDEISPSAVAQHAVDEMHDIQTPWMGATVVGQHDEQGCRTPALSLQPSHSPTIPSKVTCIL